MFNDAKWAALWAAKPATPTRWPRGGSGMETRYTDAYRIADAIIITGRIVKVIGGVLAAAPVVVGTWLWSSGRSDLASIGVSLLGVIFGFFVWIAGIFVTAQGQLLRALLDTAVNTSPLIGNTEKAEIMGITYTTSKVSNKAAPVHPVRPHGLRFLLARTSLPFLG